MLAAWVYASSTKLASSSTSRSLDVVSGETKIQRFYRSWEIRKRVHYFLLSPSGRTLEPASGLLCLLYMQVAIVSSDRHRLSCVGFAGNSVRIYMMTEYR